jgi:5-formyltetrahydrofolate cyclo-ligase
LIGIAYEFQKQQKIEKNSWDIATHAIATEHDLYITNK